MNSQVTIETVDYFTDARGIVIEPIAENHLAGQRNVHVVLTEPGGIRGNHFHERSTEILTVIGPALVRWREGGAVRDVAVPARAARRFTIPPGIPHAVQNPGPGVMLLMSFSTHPHDRAQPDAVREVLIAS